MHNVLSWVVIRVCLRVLAVLREARARSPERWSMIVDMWMTHEPLTIAPTVSVSEAALLMAHHRVRRLVVVDPQQPGLAGIVSAGDVARAFPPDLNPTSAAVSEESVPAPVATIMARSPRTIPAGTPIEVAARVLRDHKIGALPVMQGTRLIGILTESDVFRAFVEMSDHETPGARITFALDEAADVAPTMVALCGAHGAPITSLFSFHHRDHRTGERRRLGVLRLAGTVSERLLDAIWKSGYRVLSVTRDPER
jgi:acetoin utilization protein AcuB